MASTLAMFDRLIDLNETRSGGGVAEMKERRRRPADALFRP